MKKLFLLLALCGSIALVSCDKDSDDDDLTTVWFDAKEYALPANGGEVIIPVHSTGVNYATIKYNFDDSWQFTDQGTMIPREGWIEIEVIPNYPESRNLMIGRSGLKLTVKPNKTTSSRTATLIVGSFSDMTSVQLKQPTINVKQ